MAVRVYQRTKSDLGFECTCGPKGDSDSWLKFEKTETGGLYIDRFMDCCEFELGPRELRILRRWAGDLLGYLASATDRCAGTLNKRGKADL